MVLYPNGIDNNTTIPPSSSGDPTIEALRQAVFAIEIELGILPAGAYANVRTRLDILETRIGGGGGGFSAGGDLSGTNTSQTVIGIQGNPIPAPTGTNTVLTWTGATLTWGAGGGGGGGGNAFIYRDSEPSPTGNVFATFAAAYAARIAFAGPAEIWIDDTLNPGNATVHVGAFNFNNTVLRGMQIPFGGAFNQPTTFLKIADEAITWTNLRDVRDLVIINGTTSAPVITTCNSNQDHIVFRNASVVNNNAQPFWSLSGATTNQYEIALLEGSTLTGIGGPALNGDSGFSLIIIVDGLSSNNTNATTSIVNSSVLTDDGTMVVKALIGGAGSFNTSQTGFTGTLFCIGQDQNEILVFDSDTIMTEVIEQTYLVFAGFTTNHTVTLPTFFGQGVRITFTDADGSLASFSLTILGTINGTTNLVMDSTHFGARGSVTIEHNSFGWSIVDSFSTVASSGGITQLTGDVTAGPGSGSQAATVVNIHGASVPVAGSLTTGNVLQVTGASALSYGAVNLAGGANFVTGILPAGNQASQTMGGDVTGTTAASTVAKIQGNTVTSGALTKGQFFVASSTSNWAATTLSGDLTESAVTAGQVTVSKINSATVPAAGALTTGNGLYVTGASALSYSALNLAGGANFVTGNLPVSNVAPGTSGQLLMSNGTPATTWTTMSGGATISATGVVTLSSGGITLAGDVTGAANANTVISITGAAGTVSIASTGNILTWVSATTAPGITQASTSSTSGAAMTIQAQGATGATHNGGNIVVASGTSGSATAGNLQLQIGSTTELTLTDALFQWATGITNPKINQADKTTNSGVGSSLTLQAQNETGTTSTGGQLVLTSGTGTTAAGSVVVQTGGTTRLTANATGVITIANLGTGVVHTDSSGNLTSSLIVNADITNTTIAPGKLTIGTADQLFDTNHGATTAEWFTLGGDATFASHNLTVTGLQGIAVPAPSGTNTVLTYNSGAYTWATGGSGITTLTGDVTAGPGSGSQAATVTALQGNAVKVQSLGAGQDQWVLTWVNADNKWEAQVNSGGSGITQLTGDVTAGPGSGSQAATVVSITGGSGVVNVSTSGNVITWAAGTTAPGITQTAPASGAGAGTAGAVMSIISQAGGATTGSATTAGAGGNNDITAGVGGSGSGGTNANGGAGGNVVLTPGAGGAKSGSGTVGNAGKILLAGGQNIAVSALKTANYTVLTSDFVVGIGTLSGTITVTLPASPSTGDTYIVKDVNGSAAAFNITVLPASGNIDGASSFLLNINYQSVTLVYTSAQWSVI